LIQTDRQFRDPISESTETQSSKRLRSKQLTKIDVLFRTPEEIEKIRLEQWQRQEQNKREKEQRAKLHWLKHPPK
jgi:hypothetical protein